jgi:hypothetical protein
MEAEDIPNEIRCLYLRFSRVVSSDSHRRPRSAHRLWNHQRLWQPDLRRSCGGRHAARRDQPRLHRRAASKIIPFPGSDAGDPLKYKSGQTVTHPAFGKGMVIESKRRDGAEIVTVAFANKKFGIKELDAEFANMKILDK